MLQLQQNKVWAHIPLRYRFWAILAAIASFLHILFLLLIFLPKLGTEKLFITISEKTPTNVIYLPFHRTAPPKKTAAQLAIIKAPPAATKKQPVTLKPQLTNSAKKAELAQPKISTSKPVAQKINPIEKSTVIKQNKSPKTPASEEKSELISQVKSKETARFFPKKEPQKIASMQKPPIKEKEPIKEPASQHAIKKEQPTIKQTDISSSSISENKSDSKASKAQASTALPIEETPTYIGRDELTQLRLTEEIKLGVGKLWKQPAGIQVKKPCIIKVSLLNDKKKSISIQTSSGSIAYDLSAKRAALEYQFPPHLTKREIILTM